MTDIDQVSKIKGRTWITAKSRIYAENRFRRYELMSHLLLSIYSIAIIALTIFKEFLPEGAPVDAYTIVYSVLALSASIIVFGFRFGETAALHRECYLRLQELHDSHDDAAEIERNYHSILSSYPNHSDLDYARLVLSRTFPNNRNGLKRNDGTPIMWNFGMLMRWCIHQLFFWGMPILLLSTTVFPVYWSF
ncbi:MAG: hypothetical protein COA50_16765 [Flavobacteriaceae bacterium]|nr:MAG: hypothetical protein COA50_16765 [Flavobacteriaceae bacterium]